MTTERKHLRMNILLALFLFAGCVTHISGELTKNHSVDLDNIFKKFDALIKLKNTESTTSELEMGSTVVCVMSVDELNEIENALVRDSDLPDSNDVSINFSSTCTELDRLKTEIFKLKNDFKALIRQPILSHDYRNLKTSYESHILKFKDLLDSTKNTVSGERLEVVNKLKNEFQMQQQQIVAVLSKMELEQKPLNDANVQLAIKQLQQGKLNEAETTFEEVTDHDVQIEQIVASLYGNGDNFENIYSFVARLPLLSRINGYKAMHQHLKKNNHMLDHHIWMLATVIRDIPRQNGDLIEAMTTDLKTIVRNNNYDGVAEFLNKDAGKGLEAMQYFAPVFVRTIYEETGNSVEKVLVVLEKLTFNRHRLYLINELIQMLKSTNRMHGKDMSMIVFELIKLRSIKRPHNKFLLNLIEQNLPEELRDLMYNNLCLRNAENDEYLFASVPGSENQRHVYTAKTNLLNESFFWQIYFVDNGTKVLISNNKYLEQIYLIDEGGHDDEHVLRSWMGDSLKGDSKAEFYLDMIGYGQFLIVNKHFGQVLYSPFDGEPNANNNRPVFSKKYDPNNVEIDSKWIIGICRLDVEYEF